MKTSRRSRQQSRSSFKKRDTSSVSSPALDEKDALIGLPSFEDLCPGQERHQQCAAYIKNEAEPDIAGDIELGCIVRLDRGFPAVACAAGIFRSEYARQFSDKDALSPCVGDWVCLRRPPHHDMALVEAVLPRTSTIARWRGQTRGERQVLAANVDLMLIAQPLGGKSFDFNRVCRSVLVAFDCGVQPVVVLTKSDRVEASLVEEITAKLKSLLGTVEVVATAQNQPTDEILKLVPTGKVALIFGESGAGKSTLLNRILGLDMLATQSTRANDDAGRHTTVARRMVKIPGAGIIVDAPGLRSLPLLGHERGLTLTFPDIAEAATHCKFRDCSHSSEPGCGVVKAFEEGKFSSDQLEIYRMLADEMRSQADTLDPDVVI